MTNKPFFMPTGYFSIPLGLGATAIAWHHAEHTFAFAYQISFALNIAALMVWVLFISLFIYKFIAYRDELKDEYRCPVRFTFLALVSITTMIAGDLFYRWLPILGETLIYLGIAVQVFYAFVRIGTLWNGETFTETDTQPAFFLPTVAANFTSASSLALLGHQDYGWLFFGAGLISWLVFEPILLQKARMNPLAVAARPTLGILLAPAFVGSAAYLALNGGEVDIFVKIMWGYGFLQLIFLLRLLPWIAQNGFTVGFWGFSFGLASMANGAVSAIHSNLYILAIVAFVFANLMILLLIFGTLLKVIKGQFWLK